MLFAHNCKRETKNYTSLTKINLHNLIRREFWFGWAMYACVCVLGSGIRV